jgi:hypothetical protein
VRYYYIFQKLRKSNEGSQISLLIFSKSKRTSLQPIASNLQYCFEDTLITPCVQYIGFENVYPRTSTNY